MKVDNFFKKKFIFIAVFFFGILFGWIIKGVISGPEQLTAAAVREKGYSFTEPLLLCNINAPKDNYYLQPLQNEFLKITPAFQNSGLTSLSIYFRDLHSGRWTGVNNNAEYHPASTLKVPVMIAYFHEAESDPSILQKKLLYEGVPQALADYGFLTLKPQTTYTVETLIEDMIKHSDNGALELLVKNLDQAEFRKTFDELGIPAPSSTTQDYQISASSYANFFRILYNSTYLSAEYSEKALSLLSETDFKDGLVSGISSSTVASHKFGEYKVSPFSLGGELHDCGIVYYPNKPYLLCVMTKGGGLASLKDVIKKVSEITYQFVSSNKL